MSQASWKSACQLARGGAFVASGVRLIICLLTLAMGALATTSPAAAAPRLTLGGGLSLDELGPGQIIKLRGDVFHVQGVDLDGQFIYVTSVDKKRHRAYLHKFTLDGALVRATDLTDGPRYHPGGLALDGESLWVPVAETKADSSARILQIDTSTLAVVSSFAVDDHIGAVATRGERLYGASWGAKAFYLWDRKGKILANPTNPTQVRYQDMKFVDDELVASGLMPDKQSGAVDWLDPDTFEPRQRLPAGKMGNGMVWTREGMALKNGKLYLLPADGRKGSVDLFVFDLKNMDIASLACTSGRRASACLRGRPALAAR
jgi:hypothetical protein